MADKQKNVPYRRFKEFENADAWEQRKLENVVDVNSGKDYKHLKKGHISVYGTGGYMLSVNEALSYNQDAIGIGRKGTIDKPYVLQAPFWTVDTLFYSIPKDEQDLNFLFAIFQSIQWKKYDESTGVPSLSKSTINNVNVMIPKIEEQKKIGSLLKRLDNLIALHQRKYDKLKKLKSAYLTEMFPAEGERKPKRRFSGFTDDWEERKLGEVGKAKSGIGFPDAQQGGKQGTPFYKVSDMNNPGNEVVMMNANNYASDSQLKENKWNPINPQNSGVVFAKVGAAIFLDRKRIVDTSFLIDNNMMSYLFDSSWNRYFGKTLFEKLRLSRFAQVGALPSFNGSDVEDIKVMIPEESEQKVIGDMFEKLDDTIALHQQQLEKLQNLKQAYLNEMFV